MWQQIVACSTCQAAIFFATTHTGKKMPLNAEPDPQGNVYVGDNGIAMVCDDPESEALAEMRQGNRVYMPHFATCAQAAAHRKKRKARAKP